MSGAPDTELLDAMAGLDAGSDMAVVERTRRAVLETANQMRETRSRTRRRIGFALLGLLALLMFLTPMLWVIAEETFSGESWLGVPSLTALLAVTMALSIFTALAVQWQKQSRGEGA